MLDARLADRRNMLLQPPLGFVADPIQCHGENVIEVVRERRNRDFLETAMLTNQIGLLSCC